MYMYCVLYFSLQKNKHRYQNCPIFQQCLWHTRSTTLLNFLSMCVKYQDNLIIPFSDNVCDKSGKLCHCIIPVSDNVRDISGQLPCQIFWICVTYQENSITVSSHFPTMSVTYQAKYLVKGRDGEKKWGGKEQRK